VVEPCVFFFGFLFFGVFALGWGFGGWFVVGAVRLMFFSQFFPYLGTGRAHEGIRGNVLLA